MIKNSTFNNSLKESETLLKKVNLFKDKGPKDIGVYSDEFRKISRSNKHIDIYNCISKNLDYEFILSDNSFFQFSHKEKYLRYSFIEVPKRKVNKYDFLSTFFQKDLFEMSTEEVDQLISMIDENEYEQFINEQEINQNSLYIRYDYDEKGYVPLLHSCSHFHIGLNDNLRIPSSIILTPLQFVIFCIKQCYYNEWKIYFECNQDNIIQKLTHIKNQCVKVDKSLWNANETSGEVYLV